MLYSFQDTARHLLPVPIFPSRHTAYFSPPEKIPANGKLIYEIFGRRRHHFMRAREGRMGHESSP